MPEDTKAEKKPVTETQEAPTPSAEEKTTPETTEVVKEDELPESASERTKARFEELTSQLREERQRREAVEGAFKTMQPKQEPELAPIVDPNTGYIDEAAVAARDRLILEAQRRAEQAEQRVQSTLSELEAQRGYEAHPQLNPTDKQFDKELHKKARALILDSMVNPQDYGGKQFSLKEAGDYLKNTQNSAVAEAEQKGAQQAIEQLTPKEQAALEATGTPARRVDVENIETLRQRSRRGDMSAIMSRLDRVGTQEKPSA